MQPTAEFGEFTLARGRRLAQLLRQVSHLHAVTQCKASSDLLNYSRYRKKQKLALRYMVRVEAPQMPGGLLSVSVDIGPRLTRCAIAAL